MPRAERIWLTTGFNPATSPLPANTVWADAPSGRIIKATTALTLAVSPRRVDTAWVDRARDWVMTKPQQG